MPYTETVTTEFKKIVCCNCSMPFLVPEAWEQDKRNTGQCFKCPNDHPLTFGEGEIGRLRKQLVARQADLDQARAMATDERAGKLAAEKAKAKLERRVKAGACPCCKRNFENLGRHMKTKHPTYATQEK